MSENINPSSVRPTGRRRYCFVMMSYHEDYTFYEKLKKLVSEVTGFECVVANEIPRVGADLHEKIHKAIRNSEFGICDVSQARPNIYYEFGYAIGCGKTVLLIAKEGSKIHTDLQGLEIIRYRNNREGWQVFESSIKQHLEVQIDDNISLLRSFVLPSVPRLSIIILNPKQLQIKSRFKHHPKEIMTWGDYLGLSGIMVAFVSFYGEHLMPEIINAAFAKDDFIYKDANLFLIGSPKVNKFTDLMLRVIQQGKTPNWRFEKCHGSEENDTDYEMCLLGNLPSERRSRSECIGSRKIESGSFEDYGLIIRASHPFVPNRSVLILAGPHSLGTGSACLASTKSVLIQQLNKREAWK